MPNVAALTSFTWAAVRLDVRAAVPELVVLIAGSVTIVIPTDPHVPFEKVTGR